MTTETTQKPSIVKTFTPGMKLGESGFTLKQKITASDLGEIWLAREDEADKDITLLFLPDELLADARVLGDLRNQVKQNRQLIHPRVLRTYDFIEEEGWAAISSDAVDAEMLASLLAKKENKCFDVSEIKPWVTVVCQTLDEAHRANLLHRDLSPENILVAKSGDVLVANFGISRIIRDALDRVRSAKPAAHLAYVSPQQLDGEHPARWDDVYSLGVLIYALLTGKPPFEGADILTQIRKTVPGTIASRRAELGIKGEGIPENWEKVVAACLSKHTPQRPKSAREVGVKLGADITALHAAAVPVQKSPVQETPPAERKQAAPDREKPAPKNTEAAPARKEEKKESAKERKEVPATTTAGDESVEDILWKKDEPLATRPAPRVNPASPFAHLLQQVEGTPKEAKFPTGKAVAAGAAALVVLLVILLTHNHDKPAPKTALITVPSAAPSATASTGVKQPVASPAPTAQPVIPVTDAGKTPAPAASPSLSSQKLDEVRKAFAGIKQARDEKAKVQQATEADAAQAQKALDEKLAAAAALKKTMDDAAGTRKQLEDAQTKAAADADAAQKVAVEKTRLADEAKKATEQLINQIKDQQVVQQKVDAELPALQKTAADRQKAASDALIAAKDAEAHLQLQEIAVKDAESEAAAAAAATTRNTPSASPSPSVPVASPTASPGITDNLTLLTPDKSADPIETAEKVMVDKLSLEKGTPAPGASATPAQATMPVTYVPNPKSKIDKTMQNSLGMKFAPVGDVLFGIWPVRVQDFQAFADATGFKSSAWLQPGFKQGPDHPVVNVTWQDAMAFCKWLTEKDQKAGLLAPNQVYRLPTDLEWSKAVGLPDETAKTPDMRDMDVPDVYPWGTQWPPPKGAGNYTGEETGSDVAIKGYDDGYAWTAPVGSFNVNKYGLYDMGGNVWQWCMDWLNGEQKTKVLRGASWYNGGLKLSLLSSCRLSTAPDITTDNYGFRCVIAPETRGRR